MHCIICNTTIIATKNILCAQCWKELSFIVGRRHTTQNVFAMLEYNEIARKLIHSFKYQSPSLLIDLFVNWISFGYQQMIESYDIIIPVPIHKYKLMKRGYNQSAVLAKAIAKRYKKQCYVEVLIKTKNTISQSMLNKQNREVNVIDTFQLNPKMLKKIQGKKILFIDDVITTGSTIVECLKALRDLTDTVQGLCIAMTINYNNI